MYQYDEFENYIFKISATGVNELNHTLWSWDLGQSGSDTKHSSSHAKVGTHVWVNIISGYGILPDGTKPLPEAMLTSSVRSSDKHLRTISL